MQTKSGKWFSYNEAMARTNIRHHKCVYEQRKSTLTSVLRKNTSWHCQLLSHILFRN